MSDVIKDLESEIVALEQLLELKRARLAMEKSRWKPKRPLDGERVPYAGEYREPNWPKGPMVEWGEPMKVVEEVIFQQQKVSWWRKLLQKFGSKS